MNRKLWVPYIGIQNPNGEVVEFRDVYISIMIYGIVIQDKRTNITIEDQITYYSQIYPWSQITKVLVHGADIL